MNYLRLRIWLVVKLVSVQTIGLQILFCHGVDGLRGGYGGLMSCWGHGGERQANARDYKAEMCRSLEEVPLGR